MAGLRRALRGMRVQAPTSESRHALVSYYGIGYSMKTVKTQGVVGWNASPRQPTIHGVR